MDSSLRALAKDTISVERVTRRADTVEVDGVDRFPRVRLRHTEITLAPDGSIRHLVMDVRTPSEPAPQRARRVVADVTGDSVHIAKRDSTGTRNIAFATGGVLTMAHVPQMYSLYELYFDAALKHAAATKLAPGDSVYLHQFYLDREFDDFPLHDGFVHPLPRGRAEIWHDWLAGIGEATFDSSYHMLSYSGARSTYKIEVERVADAPDVEAIGARFAAAEQNNGGVVQLSVRDTTRATIGSASFIVDYGRPLARGRVLLGGIIPYDEIWRTGANAATQFSTSAPVTLAGLRLPAGKYTLWTAPSPERRRPDHQQADGTVGHGLRSRIRSRQGAAQDGDGHYTGREVHYLHHESGRKARRAGAGMGNVPVDGADRSALANSASGARQHRRGHSATGATQRASSALPHRYRG